VTNLSIRWQAFCASALFILLGTALIPFAGVQNDEALFGVPLYLFNPKDLSIIVFHRHIPLMVMSYVGTLKTWIYSAIFLFASVDIWTVRLPMVVTGALTVFVFCRFTSRAAGPMAAVIAAFLLATDPSFVVTNTFDWGPVALGHFLLVTGCFFLLCFWQEEHKMRNLVAGFFFLGLGLWNKALMLWALAGLVCAVAMVFWPELRKSLSRKSFAIGVAAFLFGALPFVLYNIRHANATLGGNAHLEAAPAKAVIENKLFMERGALNGSGLFGFIPAPDWIEGAHPPVTRRGRFAQWIRDRVGERQSTGFEFVFLLAVLAVPWWWRVRAARFALVFMMVTWLAMAVTRDAGGAIHHAVLLWPFPQFFVAVVLASLPWKRVATALAVALVAMNLLVVNEYLRELDSNGAAGNFTDALFPLSDALPEDGHPVYVIDWGMANTIAMFHQGRLQVRPIDSLFRTDSPTENERAIMRVVLADPDAIFVGHVPGREVMDTRANLDRAAASLHRRKQMIRIIADSCGHPVFEIFRWNLD
jgi:4-amino-4-deoxy-L-arabinose transferase-like glycosyltransferase